MNNADEVVVFVSISMRHVLTARFENCRKSPREVARRVFEIAESDRNPKPELLP